MQERNIQRKVRPTHPGVILRNMPVEMAADGNDEFASLTQKELAKRLGVSPRAVNELIHERRSMTADMAPSIARVQDHARHLDEFAEGRGSVGRRPGKQESVREAQSYSCIRAQHLRLLLEGTDVSTCSREFLNQLHLFLH